MKVLTVKELWVTLIVSGCKIYKFRNWKTNYSGIVLIHASKSLEFEQAEKYVNYNLEYSCGEIIGEVELVDCIRITEVFDRELKKNNPIIYGNSGHFGMYA